MNQKIFKYITPLRISTLAIIVQAAIEYNITQHALEKGYEPGLGGLFHWILGFLAIVTIFLDLFLSSQLDYKMNWIIQLIIVAVFLFMVLLGI